MKENGQLKPLMQERKQILNSLKALEGQHYEVMKQTSRDPKDKRIPRYKARLSEVDSKLGRDNR